MSHPRTVTISIPPELARRVDHLAKTEGRTRSELFREAVRQYLEGRERWNKLFAFGQEYVRRTAITDQVVLTTIVEGRRGRRGFTSPTLTPAEADVLRRLAGGATIDELSSALDVTHDTVRSIVEGIAAKLLGATNREAAAADR